MHNEYRRRGKLSVETLGRGFCWFDAGLFDSLLGAAQFVQTVQKQQGMAISCPEEIAYCNKWITAEQLLATAQQLSKNDYGAYLKGLVE
jgi:glucose-1-phosphate thymidylyltransferase